MRIFRSLTPLLTLTITLFMLFGLSVSTDIGSSPLKWQTSVVTLKLNRLLGSFRTPLLRHRLMTSSSGRLNGSSQIVNGCKIYSQSGQCLFCIRDSFLNATSSSCQSIPYSQLITKCNVYSNATTCHHCDAGLVVSANGSSCVAADALPNCSVQRVLGTCEECVAGSFLSNGTCSAPLAGCSAAISATTCKTCSSGFILSNNVCVAVSANAVVANCRLYGAGEKCLTCEKGYALDTDGRNCWNATQSSNQIDPNCESSVINTGQFCNVCRQGFYLNNNGQCIHAPSDLAEGCFIADLTQPRNCLICLTGFQIELTNTCSFPGLPAPGPGQNPEDPVGSALILRSAMLLFFGILFFAH